MTWSTGVLFSTGLGIGAVYSVQNQLVRPLTPAIEVADVALTLREEVARKPVTPSSVVTPPFPETVLFEPGQGSTGSGRAVNGGIGVEPEVERPIGPGLLPETVLPTAGNKTFTPSTLAPVVTRPVMPPITQPTTPPTTRPAMPPTTAAAAKPVTVVASSVSAKPVASKPSTTRRKGKIVAPPPISIPRNATSVAPVRSEPIPNSNPAQPPIPAPVPTLSPSPSTAPVTVPAGVPVVVPPAPAVTAVAATLAPVTTSSRGDEGDHDDDHDDNDHSATVTSAPSSPTTAPPATAVAPTAAAFTLRLGTVAVRCVGNSIVLDAATPMAGASVRVGNAGPDEVEVKFTRSGQEEEFGAKCVGGTPSRSH